MSRPSEFTFSVTDLALFLGKSPVTIRGWESKGLLSLPRDSGGNRSLTLEDVRKAAKIARDLGRITQRRLDIIEASLTLLDYVVWMETNDE